MIGLATGHNVGDCLTPGFCFELRRRGADSFLWFSRVTIAQATFLGGKAPSLQCCQARNKNRGDSARPLLLSNGIMGKSHDTSSCHASTPCAPGPGTLSCLSAESRGRLHSSSRSGAGCRAGGRRACTLGNVKVNLGRQVAADSLAHSSACNHSLLVLPIGCSVSWKVEAAAECR